MKTLQILMSTYNGVKYIREQLDSLLDQDCEKFGKASFRILIRDDGSGDGTQDILDSVYATDCIDGDISNKVEITGDSVFFLNIAGEYEIWLQVTNSCGDMVTVPVTLEMVDYRQQTEMTKRAEAAKQTERTNLTEKATEETGQKETEGAENGTKAG